MNKENINEMEMNEESKTRNDMIAKIFKIMEIFTKQIKQLENKT